MKKILLFVLLIIFSTLNAKDIEVYTYHNHAPFVTSENEGLSYELIDFLNDNSNGKFNFKLKIIPRSRLNLYLKPWINGSCIKNKDCKTNWMLLWVNHEWGFGKDSLKNFSWIELFEDSNSIVSKKDSNFEYLNENSLIGKKLAGISGHKYVGIDDLVKEKKIVRINGNSEKTNLLKVIKNRVDVTLLPTSSFNYYQKIDRNLEVLKVSNIKHQVYMRNIMTTNEVPELLDFLKNLNLREIYKNEK